jgi:hypothetical protein
MKISNTFGKDINIKTACKSYITFRWQFTLNVLKATSVQQVRVWGESWSQNINILSKRSCWKYQKQPNIHIMEATVSSRNQARF